MELNIKTKSYELKLEGSLKSYVATTRGDHYADGSDYTVSWISGMGVLRKKGRKNKSVFKFSTEKYLQSLESLFSEYKEDGPNYLWKDKYKEYAQVSNEKLTLLQELYLQYISSEIEKQKDKDIPEIFLGHYQKSVLEKAGIIPDSKGQWWFNFT